MPQSDEFRSIKELLEIVKNKVDRIEVNERGQYVTMHLMKEQQSVMNEKLDGVIETQESIVTTQKYHTRKLEAVAGDTEQLIMDVKAIRDKDGMYHARNKRD